MVTILQIIGRIEIGSLGLPCTSLIDVGHTCYGQLTLNDTTSDYRSYIMTLMALK